MSCQVFHERTCRKRKRENPGDTKRLLSRQLAQLARTNKSLARETMVTTDGKLRLLKYVLPQDLLSESFTSTNIKHGGAIVQQDEDTYSSVILRPLSSCMFPSGSNLKVIKTIIVMGGETTDRAMRACNRDIWTLDLDSGESKCLGEIPRLVYDAGFCSTTKGIIMLAGRTEWNNYWTGTTDCHLMDWTTLGWASLPRIPIPINRLWATAIKKDDGENVFAFGNVLAQSMLFGFKLNTLTWFDRTDAIRDWELPIGASVGKKIYLIYNTNADEVESDEVGDEDGNGEEGDEAGYEEDDAGEDEEDRDGAEQEDQDGEQDGNSLENGADREGQVEQCVGDIERGGNGVNERDVARDGEGEGGGQREGEGGGQREGDVVRDGETEGDSEGDRRGKREGDSEGDRDVDREGERNEMEQEEQVEEQEGENDGGRGGNRKGDHNGEGILFRMQL